MDESLFAAVDAFCMSAGPQPGGDDSLTQVLSAVPSKVSFADLVKEMGPYLTNADGMIRRKSALLLASVLESAMQSSQLAIMLSTPDVFRPIGAFFCDRLADYPSVFPCLKALKVLLTFTAQTSTGEPAFPIQVCKAVFSELHVQAMEQPGRQAVYELLLQIVSTPVHALSLVTPGLGGSGDSTYALEFAVGFVQAFDGEKDPRCLPIALRIVNILLSEKSKVSGNTNDSTIGMFTGHVASYTQELFDVVACYFPITFTPPPNDPHGITKESLISSLRRVFASTGRLAQYVVPLCLEKLSSSVVEAKRDAMQTLTYTAESYGVVVLAPFLPSLCEALKAEVLRAKDGESVASTNGSTFFGLWTGAPSAGPAAKLIGLTAGALGMNFTGKTEVYVNGGYGLYTPPHAQQSEESLLMYGHGSTSNKDRRIPTLADEALSTIMEITRILSVYVQSTGSVDEWHMFVSPLLRFAISEVAKAVESSIGHAAARILCAISSSTHHALASVLENILPILFRSYADAVENYRVGVRAAVITLLAGLLHTIDHGVDHPAGGHPVSKHAAKVYDVLLDTLTTPLAVGGTERRGSEPSGSVVLADAEARCIAAAGMCDLAVRPPTSLLTMDKKIRAVEKFTGVILNDDCDIVREASLRALCTMASVRHKFSHAVLSVAVPQMLAILRDAMSDEEEEQLIAATSNAVRHPGIDHSEWFLDLHLPHVSPTVSRALYALGQLACISNLAVQKVIVPELLALAVKSENSLEGSVYQLRPSSNGSHPFAISIAIIETLGRVVATKACVTDPDAMDAFVMIDDSAATAAARESVRSVSIDDSSSVHSATSSTSQSDQQPDTKIASRFDWNMKDMLRSAHSRSVLLSEDAAAAPESDGLALVPTLFNLLVDSQVGSASLGAAADEESSSSAISVRVHAAVEIVFKTVAIKASPSVQDAFRAFITDVLLQGICAAHAAPLAGTKPCPWFQPLRADAPVSQITTLPCLLKVLACSRKGAPVPCFSAMLKALLDAIFANPVESIECCTDPRQSLSARTIIELSRIAAGMDPRNSDDNMDEELALDVGTAGVSAAARSFVLTHEVSDEGTRERSLDSRKQLELQRAAVVCAQTVGVMFNRQPVNAATKAEFEASLSSVIACISSNTGVGVKTASGHAAVSGFPPLAVHKGLVLTIWLAKGLALRGYPAAQVLAGYLVDVIVDTHVSRDAALYAKHAAQGLACILTDAQPLHPFSKDSGTTIIQLYKHKLYAFVYSRYLSLQDRAKVASADGLPPVHVASWTALAVALCSMASHLPQSLVFSEIDQVLPIVIRTLEVASPAGASNVALDEVFVNVVASPALSCLLMILRHVPTAVVPHISALASILLSFAQASKHEGAKPMVRALAVEALRHLTCLPYHKLHPVKQQVVTGLLPVLDDPKRSVRRRAAACRNDWLTLGPVSAAK